MGTCRKERSTAASPVIHWPLEQTCRTYDCSLWPAASAASADGARLPSGQRGFAIGGGGTKCIACESPLCSSSTSFSCRRTDHLTPSSSASITKTSRPSAVRFTSSTEMRSACGVAIFIDARNAASACCVFQTPGPAAPLGPARAPPQLAPDERPPDDMPPSCSTSSSPPSPAPCQAEARLPRSDAMLPTRTDLRLPCDVIDVAREERETDRSIPPSAPSQKPPALTGRCRRPTPPDEP
mmetsp:Transcript_4517/g.13687  ORF Transcript_4517/g.13687 Transcript_4517/m.13687 type:complete len:239 (+) Transcript_4517:355-1071(+)